MRRLVVSLLLPCLAACGASTTLAPGEHAARVVVGGSQLTLSMTASRTQLLAGQPDTLRATLANAGPNDVTLTFSYGCQVMPYIRSAGGAVVLPDGGAWGCTAAITTLTTPAGQSVVREWVWTGSTAFASEMPLRPLRDGTYYASTVVQAVNAVMETPPLAIVLTSATLSAR